METILSLLRFSFRPSLETQTLIERDISWGKIVAVLFAGAILFQLSYNVRRGFHIDFNNFGQTIILTLLGIIVFAVLLFVSYKILGGEGSFKNHMGIFAWITIPIAIISGFVVAFVVDWNDSVVQILFSGFIICVALWWAAALISRAYSIVHKFSKTRAILPFIILVVIFIVVALTIVGLALSGGMRG